MFHIDTADALDWLKTLPDNYCQCVVTSPPYFQLRQYNTATWEGGDPNCDHRIKYQKVQGNPDFARPSRELTVMPGDYESPCPHCGAVKVDRQIGLEGSLSEYLDKLVIVFRELRRVLRDDGTLWLNMGDSYSGSRTGEDTRTKEQRNSGLDDIARSRGQKDNGPKGCPSSQTSKRVCDDTYSGFNERYRGKPSVQDKQSETAAHFPQQQFSTDLPPKNLLGVPWRLALALQADGWILRQDIIWHKKSAMPESVRDRCTKAHEYLFLLTKKPRYYFDNFAIKEPCAESSKQRALRGRSAELRTEPYDTGPLRNKRSVWSIASGSFKGAHFAVFPPKLVEPCILSGTSEKGCCSICGKPWRRITKKSGGTTGKSWTKHEHDKITGFCGSTVNSEGSKAFVSGEYKHEELGWEAGCQCGAPTKPCLVVDPFMGSGTVGVVCKKLGRDFHGCDLSSEYCIMGRKRVDSTPAPNPSK